jgi:hypothetical protein
MTSIEVELSDVWQTANFSSKNGSIGSSSVKLSASSQSNASWKPFMATSNWRSAKKFSNSDPFDATSDQWIKLDFGSSGNGAQLTGVRLKGGFGTGKQEHCSPDKWSIQYSDDNSTWTTLPGASSTDSTSTEQELTF